MQEFGGGNEEKVAFGPPTFDGDGSNTVELLNVFYAGGDVSQPEPKATNSRVANVAPALAVLSKTNASGWAADTLQSGLPTRRFGFAMTTIVCSQSVRLTGHDVQHHRHRLLT